MRIRLLGAIVFCIQCLMPAHGALLWQTDLGEAQRQAKEKNTLLLLLFSDPAAPLSAHNLRACENLQVQAELAHGYELVQLDFGKSRELAQALHVFKAGSIALYAPDGSPLGQFSVMLPPDQLAAELRAARLRRPGATALGEATAAASPAPPPSPPSSAAPTSHAARHIAGPRPLPLKQREPLQFGILENGKRYLLRVEGTGSVWGGYRDTVDAIYYFRKPGHKGPPIPGSLLGTGEHRLLLLDQLTTAGIIPPYNPQHIYHFPITGEGKPFLISIVEKEERGYADNSGIFQVSILEEVPMAAPRR